EYPQKDKWYDLSFYFDFSKSNNLQGELQARSYAFFNSPNGKKQEFKNYVAINLTESFGRGNEHSKLEMDNLLDKFDDKYIDGDAGGTLSKLAIEEMLNNRFLENLIDNGDFSKGDYKWGVRNGSVLEFSNGKLKITGTNQSPFPTAEQEIEAPYSIGDKIFLKGTFTVKNDNVKRVGFAMWGDDASEEIQYGTEQIEKDKSTEIVKILQTNELFNGNVRVALRTQYDNASSANNKSVDVKDIIALNLA